MAALLAEPEYDIGICAVEVSASKVGHSGSRPSEEDTPPNWTNPSQALREKAIPLPFPAYLTGVPEPRHK